MRSPDCNCDSSGEKRGHVASREEATTDELRVGVVEKAMWMSKLWLKKHLLPDNWSAFPFSFIHSKGQLIR